MMRFLRLRPPLIALVLTASTFACSSEKQEAPGQIVVSISTDMEVTKDIDEMGVEVLAAGNTQHSNENELGRDRLRLPATLSIVAGDDPATPVTIRVYSRKNGVAKTFREIVTTVPPDRIAVLPVGIQWLCWNQVSLATGFGAPESTCPEGQTCIAGTCGNPAVDSTTLADYTEEAVFGGGTREDGNGQCLDTVGCFSTGSIVPVDPGDCSIVDPGGSQVNVSIALPPGSPGICGPEACLIPLDAESPEGWVRAGGRLKLPHAACDRPESAVAVTTACPPKTSGIPTCGNWSVVEGNPQGDEGAPDGYQVPTGDAGSGDAAAN
jgi:hypothetical protein